MLCGVIYALPVMYDMSPWEHGDSKVGSKGSVCSSLCCWLCCDKLSADPWVTVTATGFGTKQC